ncbi:hypothetical protein [Photorhabdus temperata]|uniref:Uncharacterized protein n=2 Tax=Photorhabdus temperata TaxID=574560 RepID=A0A081S0N0_PHOTE|nr:hypothetical protein [Photorhabdus temperata]EQB99074.1 gcn5-related n-acetyltransferase [Photorhabdus temperata subsp. temperata M1021]ERT11685.1 hypothetical protein O185_18235 [Photorhabdus temperata J3]KER04483.1 hypothetical protein MEG1DRAFT_00772 [Photorhabdus temperata subsp. temperata Meg1]
MTINNMTVRMENHEDNTVINNIELQAASLFPDELLKILAEEVTAGLGARVAMKLTIKPKK